jgi:guanylate kinase
MKGKFILVIGPTGSGKSVLINYVREQFSDLLFPVTYTTREKRPGYESSSYRFLSVEEFQEKAASGDFIEWAQYGGNVYGTSKEEITTGLSEGKVMLKEMEVQGVRQIQSLLPKDELALVYIDAGSWDELEKRIRARAPISDEEVALRKKRFEDEVPFKDNADFVIPNPPGELDTAKEKLVVAISAVKASIV